MIKTADKKLVVQIVLFYRNLNRVLMKQHELKLRRRAADSGSPEARLTSTATEAGSSHVDKLCY